MDSRTTIIAVDLHGVLFKHNYKKMLKLLFTSDNKLKLMLVAINPFLWIDILKLIYNGGVAEEFLVGLAEKHHRLKPFVPRGIAIANEQRPIPEVLEMLVDLKSQGYQLDLFSNIGAIVFEDLQKTYADIINLFDSFTIPSRANGYCRKPRPGAFKAYLSQHNSKNKQVVFIDDKKKNVKAAKNHGITPIFFTSPSQLKRELLDLGFLFSEQ